MHDTCAIHGIRILITNPPKLDNKPHVTPRVAAGGGAQRHTTGRGKLRGGIDLVTSHQTTPPRAAPELRPPLELLDPLVWRTHRQCAQSLNCMRSTSSASARRSLHPNIFSYELWRGRWVATSGHTSLATRNSSDECGAPPHFVLFRCGSSHTHSHHSLPPPPIRGSK